MRKLRLTALAMWTAALVAAGCNDDLAPDPGRGNGPGQDPADEGSAELPASAVEQIEALIAEKEARTPAQRKMSSQLIYMASGRFDAATAAKKDPADQIVSLTERDPLGRVLVDVKGDLALQGTIESLGGAVVASSSAHGSIRAWVPLDSVETLAGESSLISVRPAFLATTARADVRRAGAGAKFRLGTRAEQVAAAQRLQASLKEAGSPAAAAPVTTNSGSRWAAATCSAR